MQIVSEAVCMKCQNMFSGKNKKNINLSSAEFSHRVVKVKQHSKQQKTSFLY